MQSAINQLCLIFSTVVAIVAFWGPILFVIGFGGFVLFKTIANHLERQQIRRGFVPEYFSPDV